MKNKLEERIQRTKVLFKELGFTVRNPEQLDGIFTCEVQNNTEFLGGVYIDVNSRFIEIAYTYSFSLKTISFLKSRIEEILRICYEYGSYCNFIEADKEILFSIYTKLYYTGLNYYSLRDTLKDFRKCIVIITKILDFDINTKPEKGK
ncbi:MAG: hypothetical protein JXJ04_24535 [Spirochaetales bacterium]|nr:hypothetical protein [Spirochaetales bacterium]